MNKKQTAVEWLELELSKLDYDKMSNDLYLFYMAQMFDQAKEMEKEQIEEAFANGVDDEYEYHINNQPRKNTEQYYNETYEN
jgi:hypothetical protein